MGFFSSELWWFHSDTVDYSLYIHFIAIGLRKCIRWFWDHSYFYTAHHFFSEKQFENWLYRLWNMKTPSRFQWGKILSNWSCIPSFIRFTQHLIYIVWWVWRKQNGSLCSELLYYRHRSLYCILESSAFEERHKRTASPVHFSFLKYTMHFKFLNKLKNRTYHIEWLSVWTRYLQKGLV